MEGAETGASSSKAVVSGTVLKLSNHGWSVNERYLRLDKEAIYYFSKTTPDVIAGARKGTKEPKQSISLAYVKSIGPFETKKDSSKDGDDDSAEIKKFKDKYSDASAFKVVFYESALVDGDLKDQQPIDQNKDTKIRASKLKTWYIVVTERGQTASAWISFFAATKGKIAVPAAEESKQ